MLRLCPADRRLKKNFRGLPRQPAERASSRSRLPGFLLLALALALTLTGCGSPAPTRPATSRAPFWPPLPDRPRFEYEFTLRTDLSIQPLKTGFDFKAMATNAHREPRIRLVKPLDVAARRGHIIVSDTVMRVVTLFNVPARMTTVFGTSEKHRLRKPLGVAIDDRLNYYVADAGRREVLIYDQTGHFLRRIGDPARLQRPTDVAVRRDGQRIYVVDTGGVDSRDHKVVAYDAAGRELYTLGPRGTGDGRFNLPTFACVAPDGTLYVLDAGNFRIQAFDEAGRFLRRWGGLGSGLGQLARPRGLACDDQGRVYVSDARFANVQIFDASGRLLMALGEGGYTDRPGRYALIAGIAVDETGRLYVVDQRFRKVEVIRPLNREEGRAIREALQSRTD